MRRRESDKEMERKEGWVGGRGGVRVGTRRVEMKKAFIKYVPDNSCYVVWLSSLCSVLLPCCSDQSFLLALYISQGTWEHVTIYGIHSMPLPLLLAGLKTLYGTCLWKHY